MRWLLCWTVLIAAAALWCRACRFSAAAVRRKAIGWVLWSRFALCRRPVRLRLTIRRCLRLAV
eukprot:COSAG04_NODE_123_length_24709_cov_113.457294_2_plen_63_part_00